MFNAVGVIHNAVMLLLPLPRRPDWRHPPLVTLAIIALCTFIYFACQGRDEQVEARAWDYYENSDLKDIEPPLYLHYLQAQGKTEVAKPLERALAEDHWQQIAMAMEHDRVFMASLRAGRIVLQDDPGYATWLKQRRHFDTLRAKTFTQRFGFSPADPGAVSWISHMFLHGSDDHLVGNMVVLFIAGYLVEEALGARRYLLFYLLAGLGSALLDFALNHGRVGVSIGASGAISGVMAMFVTLFGRRPIRFFYWVIFYFDFFTAPAILALPFWIANEVYQIWAHPWSNVNYTAHIGGFIAGSLLAAVYRRRYPARALPDPTPSVPVQEGLQEGLVRVDKLLQDLRMEEAQTALRRLCRRFPGEPVAVGRYYQVAKLHPSDDNYHQAAALMFALPTDTPASADKLKETLDEYVALAKPSVRFTPDQLADLGRRLTLAGYGVDGERLARALQARAAKHPGLPGLLLLLAKHHAGRGDQAAFRDRLEQLCQAFPATEEARVAAQLLR